MRGFPALALVPCSPKARLGGIVSFHRSPTFMFCTARSKPCVRTELYLRRERVRMRRVERDGESGRCGRQQ